MRIAVLLVACLGLALGASVPAPAPVNVSSTLPHDLEEFYNLLPQDQILNVVNYYLYNDEEVSELLNFVLTQDFFNGYLALYLLVSNSSAFIDLQLYLEIHGVFKYEDRQNWNVEPVLSYGQLAPITSTPMATLTPPSAGRESGYKGMIDEIKALIPAEKVNALWRHKVASNPDFKEFADKFESEDFVTLAKAIEQSTEYKKVVNYLEEKEVNVQEVILFVQKLFERDLKETSGTIMQRTHSKGLLIVLLVYLYIWSTYPSLSMRDRPN